MIARQFSKRLLAVLPLLAIAPGYAQDAPFRFESVRSLEAMHKLIDRNFPLASPRKLMRAAFVELGGASLREYPGRPGTEKYLYDINLCGYYVWRWNISADYDGQGKLLQAYVNGEPVFVAGTPKRIVPKVGPMGGKSTISHMQRPRPEAAKGEVSLGYILFDGDSNLATKADQALIGFGPSLPDPLHMGKMALYSEVEPWRSIFDTDAADRIVPFEGDCAAADAAFSTAVVDGQAR